MINVILYLYRGFPNSLFLWHFPIKARYVMSLFP